MPLLYKAKLTGCCTEEHSCLLACTSSLHKWVSVTEELLGSSPSHLLTSHSQFLPCKTPTGARLKLSSSLLSTNPNKENQWSNLLSCWCLHNPISVPVFALPLLIALMRLESKLKNPAIVSAARSYDSENTEPADLVSKMELLLPTPHTFFKK